MGAIFQMGDPEKRIIVCFYFKIITISVYNINYMLLLGICNDLPSLFPIQFQTVYVLVLPSARCESHKAPWDCIPTDPGWKQAWDAEPEGRGMNGDEMYASSIDNTSESYWQSSGVIVIHSKKKSVLINCYTDPINCERNAQGLGNRFVAIICVLQACTPPIRTRIRT